MLKKITFTILLASGFTLANFSTSLFAEGNHKHKHADAGLQDPSQEER